MKVVDGGGGGRRRLWIFAGHLSSGEVFCLEGMGKDLGVLVFIVKREMGFELVEGYF